MSSSTIGLRPLLRQSSLTDFNSAERASIFGESTYQYPLDDDDDVEDA